MMLVKIKPLYNLLKQEHKTFVDGLFICPLKDVGSYCKLPPSDIWKLYREKHSKEHTIHKFYKSKEILNLDESFEIGGYSYILFNAIMQINKVFYVSYSKSFHLGYDIVNHINSLLLSRKNACEWLMRNYKKGQSHWTNKIYSNDVLIKKNGLQYSDAFKEITDENGTWPTEETLKKGICYRTTIDFSSNNRAWHGQPMRIPELSNVPHREKWKVTRNWLSEVAKKNPDFIGGWFNLKYPKAVEIGGVTHSGHATGYSVCRDDPKNPTINICNTWGGTCSQGKHNPWGPGWESSKIILEELQLIQYFPPI